MLDLNDPLVWDKWRANYDTMTSEEHIAFSNACEEKYPDQKHFTKSNFDYLFSKTNYPFVVEVGGWKGELAIYCLSSFKIESWFNIEICKKAVQKSEKTLLLYEWRYRPFTPNNFFWFKRRPPFLEDGETVFIASHTIEHLSDQHLSELIAFISNIPTVMFEAPIKDSGDDWTGYVGTHILKMGWNGVNDLMRSHGYSVERVNEFCHLYRK